MIGFCIACGIYGVSDRCHLKSKGSGGTWEDENIVLMCREHHSEQHKSGWSKFLEKYPMARHKLKKKGWSIVEVLGVKKLVKV